jgi:hypothetical protein
MLRTSRWSWASSTIGRGGGLRSALAAKIPSLWLYRSSSIRRGTATESRLAEWLGTSAFDAWGDDVSRALGEGRQDNDVELLPLDVVAQGFRRSATRFLARRIHAVVDLGREAWATAEVFAPTRLGHAPTPVPGCQFSVTTNSHGLRVVYSGAYRRSKGAFGAPTTPVRGALQSGDYQFGVDGGPYGQRGRWDNAIVTLPGPATVHLHF